MAVKGSRKCVRCMSVLTHEFTTAIQAETAPITGFSEGQLSRILTRERVNVITEMDVVDAIRMWMIQSSEGRKGGLRRLIASGVVRLP
eukprot:CAMPEP_0185745964 /NCGR_PEP_ID=MMETSP1174-20130828/4354_1 /TAXON_ID=35687 /ORGANISM="Dictyocha speculum, Strain CCMP1381" /LENGTH=87 /DNA_ID=CAMNT_0028420277 /DNA_START=115 /DNA_END=375 /DNA_ORIENTATION=-